jgi:hypothetical protein
VTVIDPDSPIFGAAVTVPRNALPAVGPVDPFILTISHEVTMVLGEESVLVYSNGL